jgi:hypothetical protein
MSSTPQESDAAFSQRVREQIVERLTSRGATTPCTMCGHDDWGIGHFVTLVVTDVPGQLSLGGRTYPMVSIICTNCGNTNLVNLLVLGFSPDEWPSLKMPFTDDNG